MYELELLEDVAGRLDDAYEFLSRNKRNIGYSASTEYLESMNAIWDAQTKVERLKAKLEDRYAVIAKEYGNDS